MGKNWEPFVDWIYKRRTGVSGMGSGYGIRNLKEKTFPKLNLAVRSILSKSENNVTDDVLKEIGKEIKKHHIENYSNPLIEIMGYNLFTTFDSTATLQDNHGKFKYDCGGEPIKKKENG